MDAKKKRFARTARLKVVESGDGYSAAALRAELVLLREENARLKVTQYRPPDLGTLLDNARALPGAGAGGDQTGDETAAMLIESLVLRDSLMKLCAELSGSLLSIQSKLRGFSDGESLAVGESVPHHDDEEDLRATGAA